MEYSRKDDFSLTFMTDNIYGEHLHQSVEFIYVLDGCIRVRTIGNNFVLKDRDCVLINSNHIHGWIALQTSYVCILNIDYAMLVSMLEGRQPFFYCNSSIEKSDRYEGICTIMEDLLVECAITDRMTFQKKSIIYRLLQYLVSYFKTAETEGMFKREDTRIERVLQYINANYNYNLTFNEAAKSIFMSPSAFSRFFKKQIGINFTEYINKVRLQFALEDICYTDRTISWIAENHGFTNSSIFCKNFKKVYGISPSQYRKRLTNIDKTEELQTDRRFLKRYLKDTDEKRFNPRYTQTIQMNIDCQQQEEWNNPWGKAIHLGNAVDLLMKPLQDQILDAKKHLGFIYGRITGLFSEKMLLREKHAEHIKSFYYIDIVLDFLVENEIFPMICVDNKPAAEKDINEEVCELNSEAVFGSLDEFCFILEDLMLHIVRRYGQQEVSQWIFECRYNKFHQNVMGDPGDFSALFSCIYGVIKRYCQELVVGCGLGTAVSEHEFFNLFQGWHKQIAVPDFISINLFPYSMDNMEKKTPGKRRLNLCEYYLEQISCCRNIINGIGWKNVPLYVTEWNMSMSQRNLFNSTCGKATLMLQQMFSLQRGIDMAVYMKLSDFTTGFYDAGQFLFGGYGLVTVQGIHKPAWYAMYFINKLGRFVIEKGRNYIITANGYDQYEILCFNPSGLRYWYYVKDESDINISDMYRIFEAGKRHDLAFNLKNIKPGKYFYKEYYIRPGIGSFLELWKRMGAMEALDEDAVDYLQHVCVPEQKSGYIQSNNDTLVFIQSLYAQEIKFIKLFQ